MFEREAQRLGEFFSNLVTSDSMSKTNRKIKSSIEFLKCANEQTGSASLELMIESEVVKNRSTLVSSVEPGKSFGTQAESLQEERTSLE